MGLDDADLRAIRRELDRNRRLARREQTVGALGCLAFILLIVVGIVAIAVWRIRANNPDLPLW